MYSENVPGDEWRWSTLQSGTEGWSDAAPPEGRGEQLRGDMGQPPATGTRRQDRVNTSGPRK